mmetsp:Transcript_6891/g.12738  ORF Transcript_6891/g.12738 Transcript_6891/m.12738 type:complete len:313 (-) Transcript_6891:210-1148(-)
MTDRNNGETGALLEASSESGYASFDGEQLRQMTSSVSGSFDGTPNGDPVVQSDSLEGYERLSPRGVDLNAEGLHQTLLTEQERNGEAAAVPGRRLMTYNSAVSNKSDLTIEDHGFYLNHRVALLDPDPVEAAPRGIGRCLPYALRRRQRLTCCIFVLLCVLSAGLALIFLFRDLDIDISSSTLHIHQSETHVEGTLQYVIDNPNFLQVELNQVSVTAFYRDDDHWRLFDLRPLYDNSTNYIPARSSRLVSFDFVYQVKSEQTMWALRRLCMVPGEIELALYGKTDLQYARSYKQEAWGPLLVSSNCSLLKGD